MCRLLDGMWNEDSGEVRVASTLCCQRLLVRAQGHLLYSTSISAFSFQLSAFSTASSGASCGWDRRQQTSAAVVCCYCLVLPTTYGPCTRRFHLSYCTVLYCTCSCTVAPACLVPSHLHLSSLQPRSGCSKTCNLETILRPLLCPYCCIHPRSHYADAPKGGEALQLLGNQAGNTSN